MFWKRKKEDNSRDAGQPSGMEPVIRASICTGEKVAGFQDPSSGHVEDRMLLRTPQDLDEFCRKYHVKKEEIRTIY